MKPIFYIMVGAMIPICAYEMSKQKCFTAMMDKASQFFTDMSQKCSSQQSKETPKTSEAQ